MRATNVLFQRDIHKLRVPLHLVKKRHSPEVTYHDVPPLISKQSSLAGRDWYRISVILRHFGDHLIDIGSSNLDHSMGSSPFPGGFNGRLFIFFPSLRDIVRQWVIRVRCPQQSLNTQEDGAYLQCWRPIGLQYIQANTPELVNVWMVNFGEKSDLGRTHGVILGEKKLQTENSSFIGRGGRAVNGHIKVSKIVFVWCCINSRDRVGNQALRLFDDALWQGSHFVQSVYALFDHRSNCSSVQLIFACFLGRCSACTETSLCRASREICSLMGVGAGTIAREMDTRAEAPLRQRMLTEGGELQ